MTSVLVSIVIPLFNARDFITACVESLEDQSYKNIEIIIIDDGSTDNSGFVVEGLQKIYSNIVMVRTENHGPSAARNRGMDLANGQFITFVDADDFLDPIAIERSLTVLQKYEADIVLYNMVIHTPAGNQYLCWPSALYKMAEECIVPSQDDRCMSFTNAAPSLIDLGFLRKNNIRFMEGKLYEDWEFMSQIFAVAKKAVLLSDGLYYYRRDFGRTQITSDVSEKCLDIFDAYLAADRNLSSRRNLQFRNDTKLLVEMPAFYVHRIKKMKNLDVRTKYLRTFKDIVSSFPPVYLKAIYGALNRSERDNFKCIQRDARWVCRA